MEDRSHSRRQTLITLLLTAAHVMVDELIDRMAAAGYADIRPADSRVFENLDPGGTQLTVLAARARMTHQSMGELVAALEARGYLERVADPADRRARLVRFTHRGRLMMRVALDQIAQIEAAWLRRMGPAVEVSLRPALERAIQTEQTPDSGSRRRPEAPALDTTVAARRSPRRRPLPADGPEQLPSTAP